MNNDFRSLGQRLLALVMEDAPKPVVDGAVASFAESERHGLARHGLIDRIAARLVQDQGTKSGLVGARGVDTATGRHLLYRADPHDLSISVYDDDGWRLFGQLLVDPSAPSPTLVEIEVGGYRAVTSVRADTGEFEFGDIPSGQARLVFIAADCEIVVDSIPLVRES